LGPIITPLKSLSLCANSTSEMPPKDPYKGVVEERGEVSHRGVLEVDDDAVKYTHPVYSARRTDYSKALSVYSASLLVKDLGEGQFELSVCAVCGVKEPEAALPVTDSASHTPSPLPPQLHLYCGTMNCLKGPAVLPMHPVLNLGSHVSSCSLLGPNCAFVAPEGVFLVDLRSASSRAKSTEILNEAVDLENSDRGVNRMEKGVAFNRTKMKTKLQVKLSCLEINLIVAQASVYSITYSSWLPFTISYSKSILSNLF
jgi:hypothetical protein